MNYLFQRFESKLQHKKLGELIMKKYSANFNIGKIAKSIIAITIATAAILPSMAMAQELSNGILSTINVPAVSTVDSNGVDLISGRFSDVGGIVEVGRISEGTGVAISYYDTDRTASSGIPTGGINATDTYRASYGQLPCCFKPHVNLGALSARFYGGVTGPFTPLNSPGTSLEYISASTYKFIAKDGTEAIFGGAALTNSLTANKGNLLKLTKPSGEVYDYTYLNQACAPGGLITPTSCGVRLKDIKSNSGYQVHLPVSSVAGEIVAWNRSVEYCDSFQSICSVNSRPWPKVSLGNSGSTFSVSNLVSFTRNVILSANASKSITINDFSGRTTIVNYTTFFSGCIVGLGGFDLGGVAGSVMYEDRVSSVVKSGSTWTYSYSDSGQQCASSNRSTTITEPNGSSSIYTFNSIPTPSNPDTVTSIVSIKDPLNRITSYEGSILAPTKIIFPDGSTKLFSYDQRQNVIQVTSKAAPGSNLPDQIISAGYDTNCSNRKTCNKPNWIKDAKGNETLFTYSPIHGGILTETSPPNQSGIRSQTRITYAQFSARAKDANGGMMQLEPIWKPIRISKCLEASADNPASCVGTGQELVTNHDYEPNNILLASTTVASGDGIASTTTSYIYDDIGNRVIVNGPRTDIDDVSYFTFDQLRRLVFEIGVDPDGAGPARRPTTKHSYDGDGRELKMENGNCGVITFSNNLPTDCADFQVTSFTRNTYDNSTGLLTKTEVVQP